MLKREHQLLQERKLLNRELERLKLERGRPGNGNRTRDPQQRFSNLLTNGIAGAPSREPALRLDLMSPRNEGLLGDLDGFERRPRDDGFSRNRPIL